MPLHERNPQLIACYLANGIGLLWHLGSLAYFASAENATLAFCSMLVLSILLIRFSSERSRALTSFGLAMQVYLTILLLFNAYLPNHGEPSDYRGISIALLPTQFGVFLHGLSYLLPGLSRLYSLGAANLPAAVFATVVGLLLMFVVFELTPLPAVLPLATTSWLSFRLLVLHFALLGLCSVGIMIDRILTKAGNERRPPHTA